MIELRNYQVDAIDDLTTAAANGKRRLLLVAPTGSGKTCISSQIIKSATSNGHRVLFLAHRRELVTQCESKLESFGVKYGIVLSGEPWDQTHLVNVASIQTLHSWVIRRKRANPPKADLVVIDEAHHYNSSKTWQEVLEAYPESIILGMTATPINRRGKGMGHFFDEMIQCPSISELREQGHLVRARYFGPSISDLNNLKNAMNGLKVVAGDYVESELDKRLNTPKLIGDICTNWARYGQNRQTLVFASGVKHSINIAQAFNALGVKAAHVDGGTPKEERDIIVKDFTEEKIKVLCNCAVFTEGTDIPSASCLVFARPTKSLLLYLQVGGRVLRTFPGKENAIFLDHAGVLFQHGELEQKWEWKLNYGEGDVKSATEKKIKLKKEIVCKNCQCIYFGKLECPECHWKPTVKGREVKTLEAYLQALDEIEYPVIDKQSWYLQLMCNALKKGKKRGLAYYQFIEKFGHKPRFEWRIMEPVEPSLEVLAWIRHRNIKWALSKRNAARIEKPDLRSMPSDFLTHNQIFGESK